MIKADRSKVPAPVVLHEPYRSDGKTELQRVTEHMTGLGSDKTFEFTRYKSAEVKEALEKLFHGKCSYCESYYSSTQPVDVEHFRPKGKVDGEETHPGYWWLAMEWTNLLPSCIDCNRRRNQRTPNGDDPSLVRLRKDGDLDRSKELSTGKACAFPLAAGGVRSSKFGDDLVAEHALLLDPTRDDPDQHIVFHVGGDALVSLVGPKPLGQNGAATLPLAENDPDVIVGAATAAGLSEKGAVSTQVYGLNRLGLVQARTRVVRDLNFLFEMSINLATFALEIEERNAGREMQMQGASQARREQLDEEIAFNKKLLVKVCFLRDQTKAKLQSMTRPQAPYSAVARAWVSANL
ncbi:hypothetical protein M2360_000773 [Rhizobium sp. SG_E_25_P2]|uniref:hypothetical protein n=1 Tax=Rhizobium sp. SG_E_25_P2 TaxID=2879942 RepID=UPI002473D00B|nr:hypothetical protein [Rhizobium sp. SG_E_25_P2]MDH6265392.1 hypothetical protein [Rhizobium sp. SG_E_25_P2]